MTFRNLGEFSSIWCSTLGQISHRTVLVSFFLNAAPDQGEMVIVNFVKAHDWISGISSLCVI
jgi:hypothetical protein